MAEASRLAQALEYLGGLDAAVAPKIRAASDAIDPVNVARRAGLNLPTRSQATMAAHFVGPGADIEGMVNDAREGNAAVSRGDLLGALGGYGSAAAAIPMMALPGTVAGVKKGVNAATDGIRAYHGSPHDFDKFDINKIGTGEGAQAYGHGLYFAEKEGVARSYRDALSSPTRVKVNQVDNQDGQQLAIPLFRSLGQRGGAMQARRLAESFPEQRDAYLKAAEIIEKGDAYKGVSPGKMYEVNIKANPDDFLDWDAPFSGQPANVQNALKTIHDFPADRRGGTIYTDAMLKTGGDQSAATEALRSAGIPGIKYLDEGSRNKTTWIVQHPKGGINEFPDEASAKAYVARNPDHSLTPPNQTRNYVVFDPSTIEILRKYGLAGLLMGGAGSAAYGQGGE